MRYFGDHVLYVCVSGRALKVHIYERESQGLAEEVSGAGPGPQTGRLVKEVMDIGEGSKRWAETCGGKAGCVGEYGGARGS